MVRINVCLVGRKTDHEFESIELDLQVFNFIIKYNLLLCNFQIQVDDLMKLFETATKISLMF